MTQSEFSKHQKTTLNNEFNVWQRSPESIFQASQIRPVSFLSASSRPRGLAGLIPSVLGLSSDSEYSVAKLPKHREASIVISTSGPSFVRLRLSSDTLSRFVLFQTCENRIP